MKSARHLIGSEARVPGKNPSETDGRTRYSKGRYSEPLKERVLAFFLANPDAKTRDCHKETGIAKSTITGCKAELKGDGKL